jgi:hypothetical protein
VVAEKTREDAMPFTCSHEEPPPPSRTYSCPTELFWNKPFMAFRVLAPPLLPLPLPPLMRPL